MVKEILHDNMSSYFYVGNIAKLLAAKSDNSVTV